jgi:hypothetical protein
MVETGAIHHGDEALHRHYPEASQTNGRTRRMTELRHPERT